MHTAISSGVELWRTISILVGTSVCSIYGHQSKYFVDSLITGSYALSLTSQE